MRARVPSGRSSRRNEYDIERESSLHDLVQSSPEGISLLLASLASRSLPYAPVLFSSSPSSCPLILAPSLSSRFLNLRCVSSFLLHFLTHSSFPFVALFSPLCLFGNLLTLWSLLLNSLSVERYFSSLHSDQQEFIEANTQKIPSKGGIRRKFRRKNDEDLDQKGDRMRGMAGNLQWELLSKPRRSKRQSAPLSTSVKRSRRASLPVACPLPARLRPNARTERLTGVNHRKNCGALIE